MDINYLIEAFGKALNEGSVDRVLGKVVNTRFSKGMHLVEDPIKEIKDVFGIDLKQASGFYVADMTWKGNYSDNVPAMQAGDVFYVPPTGECFVYKYDKDTDQWEKKSRDLHNNVAGFQYTYKGFMDAVTKISEEEANKLINGEEETGTKVTKISAKQQEVIEKLKNKKLTTKQLKEILAIIE